MAAEKQEFDVLLVYMSDRIGRIEDETPFVVEWFVQHGIEVWSVSEGEQRFDNHVDKLTCCKKSRDNAVCDGQSTYAATRIDGAVDSVVREYLAQIKTTAKSVALEKRYQTEIAEMKARQREVESENRKLE